MNTETIEIFEQHRPSLMGLAYRVLGSVAEAEDVVQDTLIAWLGTRDDEIENPQGWLTTVCVRKAVDVLKSARHTRTSYIGAWLPEPMHTENLDDPEAQLSLSESVTMAFMLVLERLAPKERAAFLLHDVFEMDYADISKSLDVSENACRKLVSRARANVQREETPRHAPPERQDAFVDAFMTAVKTGTTEGLVQLLAEDVTLHADGGGKATSINRKLAGRREVLAFITRVLGRYWQPGTVSEQELNSGRSLVVSANGVVDTVVTFGYTADLTVNRIFITRNPDKLARITGNETPDEAPNEVPGESPDGTPAAMH
ncbi:RNA polymerase sigma factor SigJ [Kordiimonas aestuarii]|uniref:RNA polymerase sigma factor SigJ n=1 Tax=Kordiimonas aestuarii TaxID=1005925 RepID=UPI0021CF9941|nr:RNA polymerase sigma factor SigJ [Kordiimonas aestuarii]